MLNCPVYLKTCRKLGFVPNLNPWPKCANEIFNRYLRGVLTPLKDILTLHMAFSFTRFVFTCNHYWAKRFKKSPLSTSVLWTVCGLCTCNFYVQSELSPVFLNSFRYELFDTRLGAISSGFIVAREQALQFGRAKWVTRERASERRGLLFSLQTAALKQKSQMRFTFSASVSTIRLSFWCKFDSA